MPSPDDDPVIDEIREIRHRISAEFDHDPRRLTEYYMQLQEQHRDRLVDIGHLPPPVFPTPDLPAAADDESAVG